MKKLAIVLVALMVVLPSALWADTAITLNSWGNFTNGQWTLGFQFVPTTNIVVTDLGSYFQGGVTSRHDVGMWTGGGALLASTFVAGSGAATDGFQYQAISPLTLLAGQTYVVGGETLNDNYALIGGAAGPGSFSVGPYLNYLVHVETPGGSLSFPTNQATSFDDWGGTFQYHAVPEPGSLALFGSGLVGLAGVIRRKFSL